MTTQLEVASAEFEPSAEIGPELVEHQRFWRRAALRRFVHNVPATVGAVVIVIMTVWSIVGIWFAPDPNLVDVTNQFAPPSASHLLGTDRLGRDILARLLAGIRVSLTVALTATVVTLAVSMVIGVLCGYFGGLFDDILSRIFDVIVTFPMILLAVLVELATGPSMVSVIVAISIASLPRYGRQWRILSKYCKETEYIQGAISLGYSTPRILRRHVLPNIAVPVFLIAAGNIGRLAVAEASLSFIGVGVQPPNASLGNMISDGQPYLQYHPALAVDPGIVLCVLSISFSFIGDALRDAFDITE
jgi:peptide/nickel transport system permease protein